jgi:hypothetical protein
VTFHDPQGVMYQFPIDKEGYYAGRDLPAGEMIVTIETESINPGKEAEKKPDYNQPGGPKMEDPTNKMKQMMPGARNAKSASDEPKGKYVQIPNRYAKKETTPLKQTVTKGDNSMNFDLTD